MSQVMYLVMTRDEDLAKQLKEVLETRRSVWWKLITKYFHGNDKTTAYYVTSEESTGEIVV